MCAQRLCAARELEWIVMTVCHSPCQGTALLTCKRAACGIVLDVVRELTGGECYCTTPCQEEASETAFELSLSFCARRPELRKVYKATIHEAEVNDKGFIVPGLQGTDRVLFGTPHLTSSSRHGREQSNQMHVGIDGC